MSWFFLVFGLLAMSVAAWADRRRQRSHEEYVRARRARLELKELVERDARSRL